MVYFSMCRWREKWAKAGGSMATAEIKTLTLVILPLLKPALATVGQIISSGTVKL